MMKTDSRKATYPLAGHNIKNLTTLEISTPPHSSGDSGMSKGFWRLN